MPPVKITTHTLRQRKDAGQSVVCVTAYDYPTATFAHRAGVEVLLVGGLVLLIAAPLVNKLMHGVK